MDKPTLQGRWVAVKLDRRIPSLRMLATGLIRSLPPPSVLGPRFCMSKDTHWGKDLEGLGRSTLLSSFCSRHLRTI